MKNSEYFWIDKSTLYIVTTVAVIVLLISFFGNAWIFAAIYFLCLSICAQYRPVVVRRGCFIVAPYSFPSVRRCRVPIQNVKTLRIEYPSQGIYKTRGVATKFLVIEDLHGKRYRNVIWSPVEFKRAIDGMLVAGIINDSWFARISESLRPKANS